MTRIELFNKLVMILDTNNIKYAITGRTEGYPTTIGSDIDIVVPKSAIEVFHHAIWKIEDKETRIVQMFQHETVAFYYIVYHITSDSVVCIQPDVCTDYYRKGRLLLTSDYMLEGCHEAPQGGFNVLSSEKEFIYYLLKKIDKRNIDEEQFEHIRNSYKENPDKAIFEAEKFWKKSTTALIRNIFENNDYHTLNNNLKVLQNGIHSSHKIGVVDNVKNTLLKIKRILNPTGLVIGVLGPDGSGKTTVMNQVKIDMEGAFRKIAQYHLFPVPIKEGVVNTDPHGKKKRDFIMSLAKLCYFIFIYNKGWINLVLPKKIRSTLIIFDRYFDDILIDPARYRNGTPTWVVKAIRIFIPQPDLWIVLDCPTEIIQARKAEVSPEETERQRKAYISRSKELNNCILVDTNREVRIISVKICNFMCEYLNKRAIKRYKK